jgi:protein TonB
MTLEGVTMSVIKNYKADLRASYRRNIKLCIIITITFIIVAFKISPADDSLNRAFIPSQDIITIEDIINTIQKPKLPDPPARPKIIEASIEDITEDLILENIDISEDDPIIQTPLRDRPKVVEDDAPFIWVEEMPQPIGGIAAIQKKVYYTEIAIRTGIKGTVTIEAVIDNEGDVIDAKIVRDIGGGLGESALAAVLATKFSPGKQRGKPVKVKVMIPIKFVLN